MSGRQSLDPGVQAAGGIWPRQALESALLGHLVMLHPVRITEDALIRELTGDSEDVADQHAVNEVIRDLAAIGLLDRQDSFILPTPAALRAYELWQA